MAIKTTQKERIQKSFGKVHVFNELGVMEEVCRGQCPNMLELIETFEDDTLYYIVTKFMPSGDLLNHLLKRQTRPTEENVKNIIREVSRGIQSLHHKNILHRDIKLENVLVTSNTDNTEVRIGDFGSAIKLEGP